MQVYIIGGTGLLGSAAAQLFLERGHSVKSIALPPLPAGAPIPQEMQLVFANYLEQSDEEIRAQLQGCDMLVFAAGVDERVEFPAPVYAAYETYNIEPLRRYLTLARECGLRGAVVLGSYFSYFAKEWPELRLCERHPYIRSRIAQEETALGLAATDFDVSVLELPYIFGTQPGRKPVWTILVEQIRGMGKLTMFPKGGTAMLTVRQVAQCIVGAAERSRGAAAYPIGYYNLNWKAFLTMVHNAMGLPGRKIVSIPPSLFRAYGLKLRADYQKRAVEPGIDPLYLADIMCRETFVPRRWAVELGASPDDLKSAVNDSIHLSVQACENQGDLLGMRGE